MILKLVLRIMEFAGLLALGILLIYLSGRYQESRWSIVTIVLAAAVLTIGLGNTFRRLK
jgi:hypothetical protein